MIKNIYINVKLYSKKPKIVYIGQNILGQDSYDVYIDTPPTNNQANQKLIYMLSEYLNISKTNIKIIKGSQSRSKIVSIPK